MMDFYLDEMKRALYVDDLRKTAMKLKMWEIFKRMPNSEGSYQKLKILGFLNSQGSLVEIDKMKNPIMRLYKDPFWQLKSLEKFETEDEFFTIKYLVLKTKDGHPPRDLGRIQFFDKQKNNKLKF